MSIKTIILNAILLLLSASPSSAAQDCISIATDNNANCSSLSGSYITASDQTSCGYLGEQSLCCCKQSIINSIGPKYIIIGSIVIVFGIITILSFVLKKNEYEQ